MNFNVGDRVVIRDWDDMEREYGSDRVGINDITYGFSREMRYLCGEKATINFIRGREVRLTFDNAEELSRISSRSWFFSTDMIKPIGGEVVKEEPMEVMETTFDFEKANKDFFDLLEKYKYQEPDKDAVEKILKTAFCAKNNLRGILSKHPNWDDKQQAIIFKGEFEAGINRSDLSTSINWFMERIIDTYRKDICDVDEKRNDAVNFLYDFAKSYLSMDRYKYTLPYVREAIQRQYDEVHDEWASFKKFFRDHTYHDRLDGYVTLEVYGELNNTISFLNLVKNNLTESTVNDDVMEWVNDRLKHIKTRAKIGMKVSKLLGKIFNHYGITDIKDMREVTHNDQTEMKDFGYNYYFAMMGDAINPIHIKKYTVISINPLDYLTMSFGKNWSSCQTIDKLNIRNTPKSYHGQSSSGTMSYMLDQSTVIFYTVDESYEGEMWKADKDRRMNFHVGKEGMDMVYGRLYPDGRDGGEEGLATQFRNTMQKVLSECLGFTNLWNFQRGTGYAHDHELSYGTHYRDYREYSVCGYTCVKNTRHETIEIGHDPICPKCGKLHGNHNSIFCLNHEEMQRQTCATCHEEIDNMDGAIYCADNGRWYCGIQCANDDEVYYCCDDNQYHDIDHCFEDNYDCNYYHDSSNRIVINDGNGGIFEYRSERNANRDGWRKNDNGEWVRG